MRNILVTGGTGFIGSHISSELIKNGYSLVIIDSLINSSASVVDRIKLISEEHLKKYGTTLDFYKGDIRDKLFLNNLFLKYLNVHKPIDAVIHCAGLKSVSESISFPLNYWDVNVSGTICLLEVMEKFKCYKLVFSSSATIYGDSNNILISEDNFISPKNTYGETKASVEKFLENLISSNKDLWSFAILRYFNPIGAHPSGLLGESPKDIPNNLFPYITQVANNERSHVNIFG